MSKPKKERSLCSGCYHEEYWHGLGGAKECWSFESAEVIKLISIPVDRPPPYGKDTAEWRMSCYNRKRMVYVKPEAITSEGYWK